VACAASTEGAVVLILPAAGLQSLPTDLELIIFDLDGTLTESKQSLSGEMTQAIKSIIHRFNVAIISGASDNQFRTQVFSPLSRAKALQRLHILPACGTRYFVWTGGQSDWEPIYAYDLGSRDKQEIKEVLLAGIAQLGLDEPRIWGPLFEDCISQISFSGLGQQAPLQWKKSWDPDGRKRHTLCQYLRPRLPAFEVHSAGYTSVEVTLAGMDKSFGASKLLEILAVEVARTLYVADGFNIDGSDVPVARLGVTSVWVRSLEETIQTIDLLIGTSS